MTTATLTDPKTLTDAELAEALAALTAEQSRRKPADAPLAVGDRVRITRIRPKYIVGRTGTVVRINQSTIDVRVDDVTRINPNYLRDGDTIRIPRPCLARV